MRAFVGSISDKAWDNLGVLFGCIACSAIARQVLHEWSIPERSSVSPFFVAGFFFVYLFWFLYGLRFSRRGIWLPNAVAATLQIVFALVIASKA
jgi:MtN3 and saliva related transmembrane protein